MPNDTNPVPPRLKRSLSKAVTRDRLHAIDGDKPVWPFPDLKLDEEHAKLARQIADDLHASRGIIISDLGVIAAACRQLQDARKWWRVEDVCIDALQTTTDPVWIGKAATAAGRAERSARQFQVLTGALGLRGRDIGHRRTDTIYAAGGQVKPQSGKWSDIFGSGGEA